MKSVTLLLKSILPLLLVLITAQASWAQFPYPVCSGNGAGKIYFTDQTTGEIHILDPSKPLSTVAPFNPAATGISIPTGASGLAIGTNYGTGPNPTYYTISSVGAFRQIFYYSGAGWTPTGVVMNTDHITGSCGAIIGMDYSSLSAFVSRWPGGAATTAPSIGTLGTVGSLDIAGDCNGNIWVISQSTTPAVMRRYNSAGTLQTTYTLTGTFVAGGGGLAINGQYVYYDGTDGELYRGVINNATNTVNFSKITTTAPFTTNPVGDMASCGYEGFCLGRGDLDSVAYCGDTARVTLTATGPGPYNWTIQSGVGTITNMVGNSALVTAWGPVEVTYMDADCAGVNTLKDTTAIFVTKATVFAGNDTTLIGCRGFFLDTLHGRYTDTTAGVNYQWLWGPLTGPVFSGETTPDPIIIPTANTMFWATVFTQNGCSWTDSIYVKVADSTPKASYTFIQNFGCTEDTIRFINTTPSNVFVDKVEWDFADTFGNNGNPIYSNQVSPTHIYKQQGIYSVLLTMQNKYCLDTFRQYVNTLHPLIADFIVDDSACSREILSFQDKSTFTRFNNIDPTFLYKFGDGDSSTLSSPTHGYTYSGTYNVRMSIMDALGCTDTVYKTIFIDTIPYITFRAPDSSLCEGQSIAILADYLKNGNTGLTIDMGDGSIFQDADTTIYAFSNPGQYTIQITAHYQACRDTMAQLLVNVRPYPAVNIGPDTVFCPNGTPLVLSDRNNFNNDQAHFLWSTGDTTASIQAKDIGTVWLRVTADGCSNTDSVTINKDCFINIPNAFTPDGDGQNDYFLPRQFLSRSLTAFKMSIYNRWGEVIYESSSINGRGWDGKFNEKEQPMGVYVYMIDATFDNGVSEHYTGNVTLLR